MNFTIIGKKLGMSQIYNQDNVLVPVTVVEAGPCPVLQVKNLESDGYNAIQIGFGEQKEQRLSKAEVAHAKKAGAPAVTTLNEIRCDGTPENKVGDVLTVDQFAEGQQVDVIGVTKGKGFQGVMRRFGMDGGPATHGSMFHRRVGSIGMRQTPGHVFKNKKMPGHMGVKRRTVQNLQIVKVVSDQNLLFIAGSLPGAKGSTVLVRAAKKARTTQA
jgi:large subunit ribosomal protein L3